MLQLASHAGMKENVSRMDRLRHKYAEDEDPRLLSAVQDVLAEAQEAAKLKSADAKALIQSEISLLVYSLLSNILQSSESDGMEANWPAGTDTRLRIVT